jgi:glycosyltransferase involved in cell wall biosynthesis
LWGTGGIGSFIQTIGRGLVTQGHKVSVVGIGNKPYPEELKDEGVEIYRLPARQYFIKAGFIENGWRIRKKLRELHSQVPIDVVEAPEALMFMLSKRTPYKKVVRMHGGHHFFAESENRVVDKWKGYLEKRSYKRADAFVAVSQFVKTHTAKYLSTDGRPVETIRYPINGELFSQADLYKTITHRLVFAGTVCEKKGIRQLVEALKLVIPRFPDVHLDVFGRDWFFPDKRSYVGFLKESFSPEVLSHVTFHGAINLSEIPSKYEVAELCVFPSHMETQGLVAPEAMFMGKPVLFSNTGPGPETIDHKRNGLLCNPHEALDIAEKIIFAFEHPKEMQQMAVQGQKDALEIFGLAQIIERNVRFYAGLVKE